MLRRAWVAVVTAAARRYLVKVPFWDGRRATRRRLAGGGWDEGGERKHYCLQSAECSVSHFSAVGCRDGHIGSELAASTTSSIGQSRPLQLTAGVPCIPENDIGVQGTGGGSACLATSPQRRKAFMHLRRTGRTHPMKWVGACGAAPRPGQARDGRPLTCRIWRLVSVLCGHALGGGRLPHPPPLRKKHMACSQCRGWPPKLDYWRKPKTSFTAATRPGRLVAPPSTRVDCGSAATT